MTHERTTTILIVDDEQESMGAIKELLEHRGYAIHMASDGSEAIELIHKVSPDLVVTDIAMPEMDGIELIRALHKESPNLPVIAMSGNHVGQKFLNAARLFGATYTLKKPHTSEDLVHTIEKALSGREET